MEDTGDRLRTLVLERIRRLIKLDQALRHRGEPGVLQRSADDLALLEAQLLDGGSGETADVPAGRVRLPAPDALTDAERRAWVRQHLRVLPGGLELT
jgi:hypothetical protein